MAALVFPTSPSTGDVFPATPLSNGNQWEWSGIKWERCDVPALPELPAHTVANKGQVLTVDAAGTAVGWVAPAPTLIMAATAPNPVPADGAQWFDETGGGLYVAYKGAWVEVGGGGSKGPQVHIGAAPPTAADGNDGDYWATYV